MWLRKAIWAIHNAGLLNDGKAGSRPGCRSIDVAVQKEMNYKLKTNSYTTSHRGQRRQKLL
jgi:hypothetical protein